MRGEKLAAIINLLGQYGKEESLAFGDSEGDIAMLDAVEHAFCVNATTELRDYGSNKKWHFETPGTLVQSVTNVLSQQSLH